MYFNFRYSNYLSMYSIVHFTLENSVSVVCSKWIFGYESNHMCYFPKKNQRKLLKENADVDINWPSFSCKINTISYTKHSNFLYQDAIVLEEKYTQVKRFLYTRHRESVL